MHIRPLFKSPIVSILIVIVLITFPTWTPATARSGALLGQNPRILPVEREFARYFVECAAGFRNGRPTFSRCGYSPTSFDVHDDEEASIQNGGVFTHNHPGYCLPLADIDVQFAVKYNLLEVRAVGLIGSTIYVYSLSRKGRTWPDIDLNRIGFDRALQLPTEPVCGWADRAWQNAAKLYPLTYRVYQEQLQ